MGQVGLVGGLRRLGGLGGLGQVRRVRIVNFELGTSCKLATAGDKLTKEFNIDKYNPKNKKDCTE